MNHRARSFELRLLHPVMSSAAVAVIDDLRRREIHFKIFEAYRTPERQHHLFHGRRKVTKAKPWQSMHQYGMACDFVIDVSGVNPWSTRTKEHRAWWDELHEAGRRNGLTPLDFEKPHLQVTGIRWQDMRRGDWPIGGDDDWANNIHEAMSRYRKGAPKIGPDYERDVIECRPELGHWG